MEGSNRVATVVVTLLATLMGAGTAHAITLPPGFAESAVTASTGFNTPVAVDWASDGRMFVAEKSGRVRVVPAGSQTPQLLYDLRARVNSYSDRGLLGLAVDRDFASNRYLWLLYTAELEPLNPDQDTPATARLVRISVNADNTLENSSRPETIVLGTEGDAPCPTPSNDQDCLPADYKWHTIGTVRSDSTDGTLWVGNGDSHAPTVDSLSYRPYDDHILVGKILHIDRDGNGLPGHAFCPSETDLTKNCTKVYAKGFRNPYRFHLRPGKGPVVGDVGQSAREEVDFAVPGGNYGWPCYEGDIRTPNYKSTTRCLEEYAKEGTDAAAKPPAYAYAHGPNGASITGGPVYTASNYPARYQGNVFIGDYVNGWIKRLDVNASDEVTGVTDFASEWMGGVDLATTPGGDLTYVDLGWKSGTPGVRRFVYSPVNQPPTVSMNATPTSGPAPLEVQFSSAGTTDPEGDPLTYAWDFGDGSTSTAANPSHTYAATGVYTARLTVGDASGQNPSKTVTIEVGANQPPKATITSPADESLYRGGSLVTLTGTGSDPEDGPLPGSALTWQILLHHSTHLHQVGQFTGETVEFTPLVDHDADSFYEIRLTATDSLGREDRHVIELRPKTSELTLASDPPGAPMTYGDLAAQPAPFTRTAAVGFRTTLIAADTFSSGGQTYRFAGWSDGGARQHDISMPDSDTTLTARYEPVGESETLTFAPVADTRVDESLPTTSAATSSTLRVDASPAQQSFLRFDVRGIDGRRVLGSRLRMHQVDSSSSGGRIFSMSSNTWSESVTWNTKPAIDGPLRASFGAVAANEWYEASVGTDAVSGDGLVSLAMDSTSSDGAKWGSRESASPPQLIIEVEKRTEPLDGLLTVAKATEGSPDPTSFASNRRVTTTAGGRVLAVHGRKGGGVQLAWKDPTTEWKRATTGAVSDGVVAADRRDLSAAIAVARNASGAELAWVVWSNTYASSSSPRPVQMRRLTNLDDPAGPSVGPVVTVDAPELGAYRPDVAFEKAPDGSSRGVVVWSRRASSSVYEVATAWFTDLGNSTPAITDGTTLISSSSSTRFGTLAAVLGGMRMLARGNSSVLRVYGHDTTKPLATWSTLGSAADTLSSGSSPAGVGLGTGEALAALESDTTNRVVTVYRVSADGQAVGVDLRLKGYREPTIASDGARAWLVMVRHADGLVVSREFSPSAGWSATDRVEIGAAGGGNHAWPSAARDVDGRLRLIVRGPTPSGKTSSSAVLGYQRPDDTVLGSFLP